MQNKKGTFNYKVLVIALLIGAVIYFGLASTGSIITIHSNGKDLPLETGSFSFAGAEGTYETVKLDCLTSGNIYSISGENDGETTICNSLEDGTLLTLSSSHSISGSSGSGATNFIETKITLPAGKVSISYNYHVSDYYGDNAQVILNMDGFVKSFKTPHFTTSQRGGSISGSDTYEFTISEPKEVNFRIETITIQKQEIAEGTMLISFIPDVVQSDIPSGSNPPIVEPSKLSLVDRINFWIQNFFDKIRGLFQ